MRKPTGVVVSLSSLRGKHNRGGGGGARKSEEEGGGTNRVASVVRG